MIFPISDASDKSGPLDTSVQSAVNCRLPKPPPEEDNLLKWLAERRETLRCVCQFSVKDTT